MDKNVSKFNVDKNTEKRTYNGIVFDSVLEMRYYRDVILPRAASGEIKYYELQKKYILQDGFEYHGKHVLPIIYLADFYIEYSDGRVEVIDVKGCPDTTAKIKRKLFWHKFPDIDYIWVTYLKKCGGWGRYDDYKKRKSSEKALLKEQNLNERKEN